MFTQKGFNWQNNDVLDLVNRLPKSIIEHKSISLFDMTVEGAYRVMEEVLQKYIKEGWIVSNYSQIYSNYEGAYRHTRRLYRFLV